MTKLKKIDTDILNAFINQWAMETQTAAPVAPNLEKKFSKVFFSCDEKAKYFHFKDTIFPDLY